MSSLIKGKHTDVVWLSGQFAEEVVVSSDVLGESCPSAGDDHMMDGRAHHARRGRRPQAGLMQVPTRCHYTAAAGPSRSLTVVVKKGVFSGPSTHSSVLFTAAMSLSRPDKSLC